MTKYPQKGRSQGAVTKNWILNPLLKSKTGEARDFKFGVRIDLGKSHRMTDKIPPKRGVVGVQGWIFKFENPLPKFGTGEARNVKFRTMIDLGKYHLEHDEIPQKRAWSGSSDQKLNFKPPSVNLELVIIIIIIHSFYRAMCQQIQLKLETS